MNKVSVLEGADGSPPFLGVERRPPIRRELTPEEFGFALPR